MLPDRHCTILAASQFGLVSRPQALACGLSKEQVAYRLRTGRWQTFLPNVYRITGSATMWEQDACGAWLWAGDGAALSHGAAARLWDFNGFASAPVEISTVLPRRHCHLPFKVHRVSKPLISEIETMSQLGVTSVRRTILDLTGIKHPRSERVLDQALARDLTSIGQMWLLYEEEWTRGRRGIAILRSRLQARTQGNSPDDSELEFLLDDIIRDFGLLEPTRQFPISLPGGEIRVDYCYPAARLVIEADSYAYHGDRPSFDADRERDAELHVLGWRVLRLTWAQLRWRREWVADIIRRHLGSDWSDGRDY